MLQSQVAILKWRLLQSRVANVSFGSECYNLDWRMYLLGSEMNSLKWQKEQSRVAKLTVSSGEMNSLE